MKVNKFREEAKKLLGDRFKDNKEEWKALFGSVELKILELELEIKELNQRALEKDVQRKRMNELTRGEDCTDPVHYNNWARMNNIICPVNGKRKRLTPSRTKKYREEQSDEVPALELFTDKKSEELVISATTAKPKNIISL